MNTTPTFTAVRNGCVFVDRGDWSQVQRVLEQGYCVAGRFGPDSSGNITITLGLMLRKPEPWPQLGGRDLNAEMIGAALARAGQDY